VHVHFKAYSRLGAALYGLKLYGDAKEAYARAVKLEPDDQVGPANNLRMETYLPILQGSCLCSCPCLPLRSNAGVGDPAV
jgi:hypothetical protein